MGISVLASQNNTIYVFIDIGIQLTFLRFVSVFLPAIRDIRVNFTAVNMASHFSGVLQLTDLDDFITPSQAGFVTLV